MLRVWGGKCAVTGWSIETVLIASHAKPWGRSSNEERLDEYNGLLLSTSIDRLFDAGLISFHDDGVILLGESVRAHNLKPLGLTENSRLSLISERHRPYLKSHREQFGFMT